MVNSFSQTAAFIWSVADILRGDFKQSQYGRVILPFTLLRRLECVLEPDKEAVQAVFDNLKGTNISATAAEEKLLSATSQNFFNTSPMSLFKLVGEPVLKDSLKNYVQCFSPEAKKIFEHFKFDEFISLLSDADLLPKVVEKFATIDLHPAVISNHEMGLVFEELIRRFAESSNETAGEHFTPRDIVRLTTALLFMEDDEALCKEGVIRRLYDPTAGTGGFLSSGMEYVHERNPSAQIRSFGQEINPESYAICKADMLIKGQKVSRIKLGNTLSNDQLGDEKFDYMLSNPPFGVDWKKVSQDIKDEHTHNGFDGRFGPGLPRISDGSLLFLLHLISKLPDVSLTAIGEIEGGGRIGIILNGSPLFTGGAGSGESEIRRYILERDLLEAVIALPTDMFYNTGIATYVWVLSNKKLTERRGKVQLINAVNLGSTIRKSLGAKRYFLSEQGVHKITRDFAAFGDADGVDPVTGQALSKIFANTDFGYRRITIERPLRLSVQMDDERLAALRFSPKPLAEAMQWLLQQFGDHWAGGTGCEQESASDNGETANEVSTEAPTEVEVRTALQANFSELKETQIKVLLSRKIWRDQQQLLEKAQKLQRQLVQQMGADHILSGRCDNFNEFEAQLEQALQVTGIRLKIGERKQLLAAVSWKNPAAEPVIKEVLNSGMIDQFGSFKATIKGQSMIVGYQPDSDLRDSEKVPLDSSQPVSRQLENYFSQEVLPSAPDAWIATKKRDDRDGEVGVVGYEIPFNRYFYDYQPPRDLAEIDADLEKAGAEIIALLQQQGVHF